MRRKTNFKVGEQVTTRLVVETERYISRSFTTTQKTRHIESRHMWESFRNDTLLKFVAFAMCTSTQSAAFVIVPRELISNENNTFQIQFWYFQIYL